MDFCYVLAYKYFFNELKMPCFELCHVSKPIDKYNQMFYQLVKRNVDINVPKKEFYMLLIHLLFCIDVCTSQLLVIFYF